jgi:hypothetical protein
MTNVLSTLWDWQGEEARCVATIQDEGSVVHGISVQAGHQ